MMDSKINDILGKELTPEALGELLNNGNISFNVKNVGAPSNISTGSNAGACPVDGGVSDREKSIDNVLAGIKENEALVKQLEDMRNDFLKDMNIAANSDAVARAAALINGDGNTNITKETFDKAEAIIDIWEPLNKGYVSQLIPLIGDSRITNNIGACSDITKAAFDGLKFAKGDLTSEELDKAYDKSIADDIADTENSFKEKLNDMFIYLINKLFWDFIWSRMWVAIIGMIEKLIARPIDTPIIILKGLFFHIPKLNTENYYRYGPIHKALNKFKMIILCRIPHKAWSDYSPEANIKIFWNGKLRQLLGLCSDESLNHLDCLKQEFDYSKEHEPTGEDANAKTGFDKNTDFKDQGEAIGNMFKDANGNDTGIDGMSACEMYDRVVSGLDGPNGSDVTPDCVAAAETVLKAAYRDAKYNRKKGKKEDEDKK